MSNHKYAAEFREEAVRQVLERGYSVKEVADNLGVSRHSLYKWVREAKPRPQKHKDEELPRPSARCLSFGPSFAGCRKSGDILKKAALGSTGQCNAVREEIGRCPKTQCLSRSLIETAGHFVEVGLREAGEVHASREVLP